MSGVSTPAVASRHNRGVNAVCRVALVVNPTSGKGRGAAAATEAADRLRAGGCWVRTLAGRDAAETEDLARGAVEDGVDAVVAVGGDGLVHLVVQTLAGSGVPLGVVPAGTGNDVARYFDLPRRDPAAAVDRIARRLGSGAVPTRQIDLARVEGLEGGARYFVTVLAAGFDAIVNERANALRWPAGQSRYTLATLAELGVLRPRSYRLTLDGEALETEAVLVAVGNGPSYGGGMQVTTEALLDDGLLDVVVVGAMTRRRLLRLYPGVFSGRHTDAPEYSRHRVRSVTVETLDPVAGGAGGGIVGYADGERLGALPLTVHVVPDALEVLSSE